MHADAGVGREKTKAQPRLLRGFFTASTPSPILSGFDQGSVNIHRRFLSFLTETGSHSELAVTHRKQSIGSILTETRIAHLRSRNYPTFCQCALLTSLQDQARLCYCGHSQCR
jgi:hypothetical protein